MDDWLEGTRNRWGNNLDCFFQVFFPWKNTRKWEGHCIKSEKPSSKAITFVLGSINHGCSESEGVYVFRQSRVRIGERIFRKHRIQCQCTREKKANKKDYGNALKKIVRAMIYSFGSITQYRRIQKQRPETYIRNLSKMQERNSGQENGEGPIDSVHRGIMNQ